MWQIEAVHDLLSKSGSIVITTHKNPDGDAIGSSLAMAHYLRMKGHEPQIIAPTDYGAFLKWMPGTEDVVIYEGNEAGAEHLLQKADLVFCLDFNDLGRTQAFSKPLEANNAPKVLIDHHLEPDGFQDAALWNSGASATAELVYDFINDSGDKALIDSNIASCIYTGIITDSGSFRFASVTAKVHRITAHLLETGIDHVKIHEWIYDSFSENSLKFFGHCFMSKLSLFPEYRTALIEVTEEDLKAFGVDKNQTEGLVNFALSIRNVVFAAVIKESEQQAKISFRSKDRFPANEFAREFFEGGGHLNASGGICKEGMEKAGQKFRQGLENYKTLLLSS